ncbi:MULTISPECIES: GspE/PulE family protein [Coprococcus]|jgi:type IV pilus assembly protein PilB|uniref:GspE/PulE family protein n=1 Tax=Coprococcus TaxID=33042 RepID=UPI000E7374A1|nr:MULTISPECIES: ATPase, T2SS/T4P/T4SS family [Coprococcus]MBD9291707.1 type II secretion system protein GspE [Coprococcus eutactus]RJW75996.1 type II secretion system protein GspE [Coprococcus sp. AF38-1]
MRLSVGRKKIRIGDVLVAAGAITEEQLQEGLAKQKETGRKLGNALVDLGFISNDMLITVLTTQLGIDYIELKGAKIEEKVIHMVPENMVTKYQAIPIEIDPDNPNILKVAMADPMDIMAMDDIGLVTNLQVEPMLASEEGIKNAIDKYYGSAQAMEAAEAYRQEQASALGGGDEEEGNEEIDNSPIVLLVKQIIEGGVRQRASDIHIEALENSVRVRYRIDGALKQVMSYDLSILAGITARIKIIGGMDIAEKRKPQDGRITIMVDRREFDVRVSILPTVFGEKTVMRLTSKDGLTKPKSALGFDAEQEKVFDNILSNPHGIILVTGPTGSGKSTTLYTSLSELNTEDVNIITVEDPVEANINGINQVQVNNKADMTFAAALRSILRQDPDIIMIGEIRDGETAGIAVQAAITGHLVVSTLHTNSAASTITRLIDMGIESYIAGDAVVGVIAQRLVRRLCTTCKQPRLVEDEERVQLGVPADEEDVIIYEPQGCPLCNDTGYSGRIGVYEMMPVSRALQAVIASGATADVIEKQALKEGMLTLKMGAAKHVLDGITSIAEMNKIVHSTVTVAEGVDMGEL